MKKRTLFLLALAALVLVLLPGLSLAAVYPQGTDIPFDSLAEGDLIAWGGGTRVSDRRGAHILFSIFDADGNYTSNYKVGSSVEIAGDTYWTTNSGYSSLVHTPSAYWYVHSVEAPWLYAYLTPAKVVIFDYAGGTDELGQSSTAVYVDYFSEEGSKITLPDSSKITKTCAVFEGWYTEPDGQGTKIDEEYVLNNNFTADSTTLYAHWTANHSFVFFKNDKGDGLYAYCTHEGCEYYETYETRTESSLSVKLTASDADYTGSAYTGAHLTGSLTGSGAETDPESAFFENEDFRNTFQYFCADGNFTGTKDDCGRAAGEGRAPVNAGDYRVQATFDYVTGDAEHPNRTRVTLEADFTIEVREQTATVSMQGYKSGDTAPTPTLVGAEENPTPTYYYYPADETRASATEWTGNDTLTPGSYMIYADLPQTQNYAAYETPHVLFQVTQYGAALPSFTVNDVEVTYDGQVHTIDVESALLAAGITNGTVTYSDSAAGSFAADALAFGVKDVPASFDPDTDDPADFATRIYYKVSVEGYDDVIGSATVFVNRKLVTASVTVADKEYDGGTKAEITSAGIDTGIPGESLVITSATAEFSDANAGENIPVSIRLNYEGTGGTDECNYTVDISFPKATIRPRTAELDYGTLVCMASETDLNVKVTNAVAGEENSFTLTFGVDERDTQDATRRVSVLGLGNPNYALPEEGAFHIYALTHTGELEWTYTDSVHSSSWNCCGALDTVQEAHTLTDGVCRICGYGCSHSGGTASCISRPVCDKCGTAYGSADANRHVCLTYVAPREAKNGEDGTVGYYLCIGCGRMFLDQDGRQEVKKSDVTVPAAAGSVNLPQTGDESSSPLPLALAFASLAGIIALAAYVRKRNGEKE